MAMEEGVNIHGSPWVRGSESGWSFSVGAYVLMDVSRSELQRRWGNSEVGASADDSITTIMGHIC